MIKEVDFSSGYSVLVWLAFDLYNPTICRNNDVEIRPSDLIHTLDRENYEVAMQAIRLFFECPVYINN